MNQRTAFPVARMEKSERLDSDSAVNNVLANDVLIPHESYHMTQEPRRRRLLRQTTKTRMWANAQPDGRPAKHR